tara:strand:- start:554 stop:661 length:108 start_codon:yes stop_codon:yes gene_type:complete
MNWLNMIAASAALEGPPATGPFFIGELPAQTLTEA